MTSKKPKIRIETSDDEDQVVMRPKKSSKKYKIILVLTESHMFRCYWNMGKFDLNSDTVEKLGEEVDIYNKHIEMLKNGTAPSSCYVNPEIRKKLFYATHSNYDSDQSVPSVEIDCELLHETYSFSLGMIYNTCPKKLDKVHSKLELIREEELDEMKLCAYRSLNYILVTRYTGIGFSMGYDLLPETEEILLKKMKREAEE